MRFASYTRKSIYSDKSDSVDNQWRMSQDYAEMHFHGQIDSFQRYCDEDFTGANTNRPDLQRLMSDVKNGMVDVLIAYQLDRISRDVKDFANIYSILEEHNVKFVSIKENIDTTTPIGRAMMYVTVVFAQMERETIAARVTDNMIGLAKKGFWTGGNPPRGYVRQRININGRNHVSIVPDPEGTAYVLKIFDTFLDNNFSLQSMERYFMNNKIRTESGAFFSSTQIYKILTMPYCVEATPEVYNYYENKGCVMDPDSPREKWDGSHGVMIYGRSTEKNHKHELQSPNKWIVCVGTHEPFMSADKWLAVQNKLSKNKFIKTMKYDVPLLKGILRCSCGSIMCVSRKKKVNGDISSWYYCLKRMRQGEDACSSSQIKVDLLDEKVLDIFRSIQHDPSLVNDFVQKDEQKTPLVSSKDISAQITTYETKIGRLAATLALASNESSSATKYIVSEMEKLDKELQELKHELSVSLIEERNHSNEVLNTTGKVSEISRLIDGFSDFTSTERNSIMKNVLSGCTWNGETLFVTF